jgi:hypothetical protein
LGRVKDVAAFQRVLVVLEGDAPYLQVFGHDGRLRQTIGRAGAGPGEFRAPFALAVDAAKAELLIVDPANARITRYAVSDTLALTSTTQVDVPMIRAVCFNGAMLVGLAGLDSVPIRELNLTGERLIAGAGIGRKASRHALAQHPLLQSYIADGPVLCAPDQGRIFVASALLGEILAFRPSRPSEAVLLSLPEFRPITLKAVGRALQLSMPDAGYYERVIALGVRGNDLEVTIAKIEATTPRGEGAMSYRVVEIRGTETSVIRGKRGWQRVGQVGTTHVCLRHDPVPTIGYFPERECP